VESSVHSEERTRPFWGNQLAIDFTMDIAR